MIVMAFLVALASLFSGCAPVRPPQPPVPPSPAPTVVVTVRGGGIIVPAQARLWDDFGAVTDCASVEQRMVCTPTAAMRPGHGWHLGVTPGADWVYTELAFVSCLPSVPSCYPTQDLGEIHLAPVKPPMPPVGSKASFVATYQANFGGIKLPGCGLHMDAVFDPFLLERFVNNRGCYEQMMQAHAVRNDNVVVVGAKSGYHGQNDIDVWHSPAPLVEMLTDIRSKRNATGEFFRVQLVVGADGHVDDMRDAGNFAHWQRDIDGVAAVTQDLVDATMTCWECRHVQDFTSAKRYIDMGRYVAAKWPKAFHGQHLISNSSSWSSWPCEGCAPSNDADDPNRGNEISAWWNCLREGWCDGFFYQFDVGSSYLYPSPGDDAMERWVEIVERLGDDPWSLATSKGNRHGWPQVPVIAFEFIYDTYWNRDPKATEAYQIEWCKRALQLGGRGCGSASVRR